MNLRATIGFRETKVKLSPPPQRAREMLRRQAARLWPLLEVFLFPCLREEHKYLNLESVIDHVDTHIKLHCIMSIGNAEADIFARIPTIRAYFS